MSLNVFRFDGTENSFPHTRETNDRIRNSPSEFHLQKYGVKYVHTDSSVVCQRLEPKYTDTHPYQASIWACTFTTEVNKEAFLIPPLFQFQVQGPKALEAKMDVGSLFQAHPSRSSHLNALLVSFSHLSKIWRAICRTRVWNESRDKQ